MEDALSNFLGTQSDEGIPDVASGLSDDHNSADLTEAKQDLSSDEESFNKGHSSAKPRY